MKQYKNLEEYKKHDKDKEGRVICIDCGIRYCDHQDLIVDDYIWNLIAPYKNDNNEEPFHDRGGVLCPNCILNRITELKSEGILPSSINKLVLKSYDDENNKNKN